LRKGVGIGALRKRHGGKARRGVKPNRFALASGSVQRKCVQALEKLHFIEKIPNGKGRQITSTGRRELDRIAAQVLAVKNAAIAAEAEEAQE
jgi:small subunit ribosomal protein S19e